MEAKPRFRFEALVECLPRRLLKCHQWKANRLTVVDFQRLNNRAIHPKSSRTLFAKAVPLRMQALDRGPRIRKCDLRWNSY